MTSHNLTSESSMNITSIDHHQRRGLAIDIIDEAIGSYRDFMLDDDFDAQRALDKIMKRMAERSKPLQNF